MWAISRGLTTDAPLSPTGTFELATAGGDDLDDYDSDSDDSDQLDLIDENIDAAAEVKLVLNDSDKGMLNPRNKFRITWDLCIVFPLLIYLAILLPFRLCFGNEPPLFSAVYWFEFLIDKLFIVDSKKHQR